MKLHFPFFIFVSLVIFGSSCKKESTLTASQPGQTPGFTSYIVNGLPKTSSEYFAIVNEGQMSLRIIDDAGSEVELNIQSERVGNYELFKSSQSRAIYRALNQVGSFTEYSSNNLDQSYVTGVLSLTAVNNQSKSISGAFFFTGFASNGASVNINNGYFTEIAFNDTLNITQLENVLTANRDTVPLNFRLVTGFSYGDTIILIKAQSSFNNSQQELTISLPRATTPGNYPFSLTGAYKGTYRQFGSPVTVSESGQLTVLFHSIANKRIVANFDFTTKGPPVFNLNAGTMIVNYQAVE